MRERQGNGKQEYVMAVGPSIQSVGTVLIDSGFVSESG